MFPWSHVSRAGLHTVSILRGRDWSPAARTMSPISSNLVWINYNSVATTYTQFSNTYYKYRFPVSMVTMQVWSQVNKVISPLPKCRSSTSIHNTKEPRQLHRKSGTRLVSRTRKIYRRFGGRKWAQRLTLLRFSIKRDGWSNRSFQILHSKNNVACFPFT